jgi:hypothetical protein
MINKPIISITTVPAPLDLVMNEQFRAEERRLHALYNAAPELLKQLESLLFIVETTAHLRGLERELLPTCDNVRSFIKPLQEVK